VNAVVRGVRVIDPLRGVDAVAQDVRIENGRITAIAHGVEPNGLPVFDLTPQPGQSWRVVCPGFIDIHAHLREPGAEHSENVASGARAAAAGGFTQIVAMANTNPPVDTPERVREAVARATRADIGVFTVAALTRGLRGSTPVEIEGCAQAGAVAFSDDGRNALTRGTLVEGLRRAASVGRAVLVHPEDESAVCPMPETSAAIIRSVHRPPEVEISAVTSALQALRDARAGHLHLQHLSVSDSVDLLRAAKDEGLSVSAEVTPHHLSMWLPDGAQPMSNPLLKVNPPLRTHDHRDALVQALCEGVVDCVATDHAPHPEREKTLPYAEAAPGMIGLETALAACITLAGASDWLPVLIERLTIGPYRVLHPAAMLSEPSLRIGEAASCVVFDPDEEWIVGEEPPLSAAQNTPLLGTTLRGKVLLTLHGGRAVHSDRRLTRYSAEAAHV
jgi:dihydroorotase